uniref:3CxxC-type domain-containing protein n=1 Tax=Gouania willdenowi TaxID=441366 RepID=A0A8C5H664_GOUWI
MATYGEEPVDSYLYSNYRPPRHRDGWKYKGFYSHYGDPSDTFNNQQRAQLRSILSQINPKLTPRLRKANTKDVAVQVNPKTDASVQCSIGPRTLQAMKRDLQRRRRPEPGTSPGEPRTGSPGGVRYPRTLAVYSPVAYRSVTSFLVDENNNNKETSCGEVQDAEEQGDPPTSTEGTHGRTRKRTRTWVLVNQRRSTQIRIRVRTPGPSRAGVRGFLEQKYGYYHCRACNLRWESAYVWCVQGTNKVYFKQFCRKCQKEFNPYRVEDITCHTCNKARCSCSLKQRHVDPKRPHRQDLCGRCKGKRLSCDSTFSFKYII